jgi:2-(1,2-epoxy-1,2-dihydrophenyl)acetyl-CoA isomerase
MDPHLKVDRRDGVAWVTLSRPNKKNAITEGMWIGLTETFLDIGADRGVRAVVIQGEGQHFSAGGDLTTLSGLFDNDAEGRRVFVEELVARCTKPCFTALDQLPQPVICSLRGHVIGAAVQFALVADLVIASDTARFSFPYVALGHTADHGETYFLPRKVGPARAMQLLLLGDVFGAVEAEDLGIVNWVVDDADLDARTAALAARLTGGASIAVTGTKALLKASGHNDLAEQIRVEVQGMSRCAASTDFVEAVQAFMEKRPPVFTGH